MSISIKTPPVWIDQNHALGDLVRSIHQGKTIAVDTESNSLFAFPEQVCLIQISTFHEDFLIDGLADLKLENLGKIFSDELIQKVFHAAEYDIMCLKRDFSFQFNNLFDTMQAARILGYEKLGLSNLLMEFFGVDQGKSFQKANWGKRPLPTAMLNYARLDTHYLIPLSDQLENQLRQKELLDLAIEDFQRLCKVKPNHKDSPLYAQVSGYQNLDEKQLRVLEELSQYRHQQAYKLNRPHFKVIGNDTLLAIAQVLPKGSRELSQIPGMSVRIFERHAPGIIQAIQNGLNKPPLRPKFHKKPSDKYIHRLESLKEWRKKAGLKMGVQSDIILPRDILEQIAGQNPKDIDALHVLMKEVPWRFVHFGLEIMNVIKKDPS